MSGDFSAQLLEQTPDAIIALSPDGRVEHWNRAAEVIFGFSRKEALGNLLNDLVVPADKVEEERQIQQRALERDVAVYESVRRRKDCSLVHVSVSTKAIRDEKTGEVQRFLSTSDVKTRSRPPPDRLSEQAVEELGKLNGELEQRLAARTMERDVAKNEFDRLLFALSHELRAPLRAIDGFSGVLLEDHKSQLPRQLQDYLHTIQKEARRATALVEQLVASTEHTSEPQRR